ncbi:MAG: hypothetical protein LBD21_03380 [Tannerellaceae bacterium]|nr:hypothetical protein [Tannerellaceae bacterium]
MERFELRSAPPSGKIWNAWQIYLERLAEKLAKRSSFFCQAWQIFPEALVLRCENSLRTIWKIKLLGLSIEKKFSLHLRSQESSTFVEKISYKLI